MAKFRYINTAIWDDDWFVEQDPLRQHLFIYFLTNAYSNIAGIYQIPLRKIAFETGIDQEKVKVFLKGFNDDGKVFYEQGWLVMKNWQKHQLLNPNQAMAVVSTVNALPDWLKLMLHDVNSPLYVPFESLMNGSVSLVKGSLAYTKGSYQRELESKRELEIENKTPPTPRGAKAKANAAGRGKAAKPQSDGGDFNHSDLGFEEAGPADFSENYR